MFMFFIDQAEVWVWKIPGRLGVLINQIAAVFE